jgi:hypothetical protein
LNAVLNAPYSQTLTATGGNAAFTWTLVSGALPPGLTLSTAGVISGTPTSLGNFSFVVQVQDSGTPQQTATLPLTLNVVPAFRIAFAVQPSNAEEEEKISPPVKVAVLDAQGNPAVGVPVTLTLLNSGKARLRGTTTQLTDVNGIATFSISVTEEGVGFRLQASTNQPGVAPAVSNTFKIFE